MVAVFFIISQVEQLQRNSVALKEAEQRTAARQVYMFYSQASLRYPEFAKPGLCENYRAAGTGALRFFFAHMLFAYDEMLKVFDDAESII